jgi:hypothetical protein
VKREEQAFHQAVARFINVAAPGLLWWHTPNASGNRGPRLGGILKSMGVLAGVPDLCIILPTGTAAFIELKAAGGSLSPAQKAFRERCQHWNCLWAEARTLDDVQAILERWLIPLGWKLSARVADRAEAA